jgi:hypothetical protein
MYQLVKKRQIPIPWLSKNKPLIQRGIPLILLLLLVNFQNLFSQAVPCRLRISLFTCSPGKELYTSFGHSAIRMIDSSNQTDNVYNFGTFNTDVPEFYKNYITGNTKYRLTVNYTEVFINEYKLLKMGISEQVLNLTCDEQLLMYKALLTASLETNKDFVYNFQYDNCTTRIGDLLLKNIEGLEIKNTPQSGKASFRNIIHQYLDKQEREWEKTGIDILLGSRTDNILSNNELMFNPLSLSQFIDSGIKKIQRPFVLKKETITPSIKYRIDKPLVSPLSASLLLLLMAILATILQKQKRESFSGMVFDRSLFLTAGIAGLLMLFLWFFSSAYYYGMNYNLLWANPANILIATTSWNKNSVKKYCKLLFIVNILFFLFVLIGVQKINYPIAFATLSLMMRHYFLATAIQK